MALDYTKAWITLAEAKRFLRIGSDQTADDTRIEAAVAAACDTVVKHIGYGVVQAAYTETLDGPGHKILLLANAPANLTSVKEDAARAFGAETALTLGTHFVAEYWELGRGPGTGTRKLTRVDGVWLEGDQVIRVVYDGGWPFTVVEGEASVDQVPASLREATRMVLKRGWDLGSGKALLGLSSVSAPQGGTIMPASTIELTAAIPKEAKELLAPFIWKPREWVF